MGSHTALQEVMSDRTAFPKPYSKVNLFPGRTPPAIQGTVEWTGSGLPTSDRARPAK